VARGATSGPDTSPGTEAMNRPTAPVPTQNDSTDALPQDPARTGTSGRFGAGSVTKAGPGGFSPGGGTGPRPARDGRDLDRGRAAVDGLLDDDLDEDDLDEDDDQQDDASPRGGARGRLRGLGARLGGSARDLDDDDYDYDEDEDEDGRPGVGGIIGRLTGSRRNLIGAGAAAVVLIVVVVLLAVKLSGGSSSAPTNRTPTVAGQKYDSSIETNFINACMGPTKTNTKNWCECALQKLEASYSQQEFLRLNENGHSTEARRVEDTLQKACTGVK
jgi:hypothetical protein